MTHGDLDGRLAAGEKETRRCQACGAGYARLRLQESPVDNVFMGKVGNAWRVFTPLSPHIFKALL